jgi:hypothetical protein
MARGIGIKECHVIKVSVKSPSLSHPILFAFTPYPLSGWYPAKQENFIQSQYEMLKLSI